MPFDQREFWRHVPLAEMTGAQWESLCDGCGKCCLEKLQDIDSGEVVFTAVPCMLLDRQACRCKDYENRHERVPDCIGLSPDNIADLAWMPPGCAYRRLAMGKDLLDWHPLVSGDPESVHRAGASVRGRTVAPSHIIDLENHVADWPEEVPGE